MQPLKHLFGGGALCFWMPCSTKAGIGKLGPGHCDLSHDTFHCRIPLMFNQKNMDYETGMTSINDAIGVNFWSQIFSTWFMVIFWQGYTALLAQKSGRFCTETHLWLKLTPINTFHQQDDFLTCSQIMQSASQFGKPKLKKSPEPWYTGFLVFIISLSSAHRVASLLSDG